MAVVEAPAKPPRILFACTLNAVRSPMAAGILGHLAGPRLSVQSAGVRPGHPDPFVTAAMDEIGIDVSEHVPRGFKDLGRQTFDTIISLSPEAHHNAVELTRIMAAEVQYWPTFDPSLLQSSRDRRDLLQAYRKLRDDLLVKIKQHFGIEGGPSV